MKVIPIRKINTKQKELNASESFSIRDVRELLAGKDMIQELHRHDFFYVLVLKKGKGNHEIDFTSYKISDHSIFFMRPGQVHQLTLKTGSTGYLIEFRTDFYSSHNNVTNQLLRKVSSKTFYQSDGNRFKKIQTLLTSIFQEHRDKPERYQEVIKANLGIFFIELERLNKTARSDNANRYTQERLEEFLELIETHITSQKQVTDYADMLNLSPYQLNAITNTSLGKTCSEVINEYRVLEAKRYLLATSNQVNQIADHLGYEDVSYFIRFFKKHTGHSPEVFRNNFR